MSPRRKLPSFDITMTDQELVCPPVTQDPRFRAGRTLIETGRASEGAIDMFETLVQECRRTFGEESVEAAACYFEYGNALFRAAARLSAEEENKDAAEQTKEPEEDDKKPAASKEKDSNDSNVGGNDDVDLALEMMETAWSILDKYVAEQSSDQATYSNWACDQLPRALLGIGDVLSFLNRHADAADAYSRAIPHREQVLKQYKNEDMELDHLKKRRLLVEANVLVAEELLACPQNEDVVTTETKDLLVGASERVEYARGYYDKARDELQETVYLMGKIAASGMDIESEKEDVCYISTMVMGVGTTLAALDEQEQTEADDSKPAAKKQKT